MTGLLRISWIVILLFGTELGGTCFRDGSERGFALNTLAEAIEAGDLIPVEIFGTDSYGVCDKFSRHSAGGSDCNRAAGMLFRLSDDLMHNQEVLASLYGVLEDGVG